MPDSTRKTVSATEISALFGESPYLTRWILWTRFARGVEIPSEENERMEWGTKLQPLIAAKAAQDMNLIVEHNDAETYARRGNLGCSKDAVIVHPERGPGALECKAVFDYRSWMDKWQGGDSVPREYEIQLQTQMFVGLGAETDERWPEVSRGSFEWGLLAVWVCAQMYYFERKPQPELWRAMDDEAGKFLDSCYGPNAKEPDPAGALIELPLLAQLYPTVERKTLDLSGDENALPLVAKVRTYLKSGALATTHKKVTESIRAEFIGLMKDDEILMLPGGARANLSTTANGARRFSAWAPEEKK